MDLQVGRIQNLGGASIPRVPATDPIAIGTTVIVVAAATTPLVEGAVTVLINWKGSSLVCVGCAVRVLVLLVVLEGRVKRVLVVVVMVMLMLMKLVPVRCAVIGPLSPPLLLLLLLV